MTRPWPYGAHICYQKLAESLSMYIDGRLWNTQETIHVHPYNTTSHFLWWSCTKNNLFCIYLESFPSRNGMVLIIRGSNILSEALPIILILLRKVMSHSSSNGCLSLWHSIQFHDCVIDIFLQCHTVKMQICLCQDHYSLYWVDISTNLLLGDSNIVTQCLS